MNEGQNKAAEEAARADLEAANEEFPIEKPYIAPSSMSIDSLVYHLKQLIGLAKDPVHFVWHENTYSINETGVVDIKSAVTPTRADYYLPFLQDEANKIWR